MSLLSLFWPPEQAGYLLKQSHKASGGSWQRRFFVLKGGFLFYFKGRTDPQHASKLHGVIPLESAKIETELPPSAAGSRRPEGGSHVITITLHSSHAFSCKHPFYVLSAPSQEVQMAWVNAMWQAAIPRADLIQQLSAAGKLADVLASYASNVQNNFPVADATVLSTGGRARTAALADVGSLAGMIRRHKAAPAVSDLAQLPVVAADRPAGPSSVLARTASGNLVTAPSSSVIPAPEAAAMSAPASPTGSAGSRAGSVKAAPAPAVAVSAAAGAAAAAAAVKPAAADAKDKAAQEAAKVPMAKEKEALSAGAELQKSESSGSIGGAAPVATKWQDNPLAGRTSRSSSAGAAVSAAAVVSPQRVTAA
ncbi:hypothetical protein ABPG75_013339 [Micractinium tetrahymenae]